MTIMTDHRQDHTHSDSRSTYDQARESAARVYHDARDKASDAYDSSVQATKEVAHRAAEGVESNPLAVLAAGLAVGALAGALLPRTAKEKELLAPLGRRLSATVQQAFAAAKEAGKQELDQAGLTPSAARDRGRSLFDGVAKAVSSAGSAAAQAARKSETA
jgi:ElaB/YqjD/DUF883 family membrane-anchored ribosome-binding protein